MNIKKKLSNPFALVIQGFGLGAMIFFATMTPDSDSPAKAQTAQSQTAARNVNA